MLATEIGWRSAIDRLRYISSTLLFRHQGSPCKAHHRLRASIVQTQRSHVMTKLSAPTHAVTGPSASPSRWVWEM
jgi:hypothetical protein